VYKCRFVTRLCACVFTGCSIVASAASTPRPLGKLVDLGGHRLHVNCTGHGNPIVVVENGLGDFSFDWSLVQARVANSTRVCTYDRAGYAWSDPGPKPRTFAQLNLELLDALSKLGEKGPFVLVGHSYGGPVVRNFALTYLGQVAGMVLVDAAFEGQRVGIGGKATMRLGEDAKGRTVPPAHENMTDSDKPVMQSQNRSVTPQVLDPMYKVLPAIDQELQLWAQSLPETEDAETSQREWSAEYFAKWLSTPQDNTLGEIPLIVLTRAKGGYREGESDIPAAQMEREREQGQETLVRLSRKSRQIIVHSGHNMELEAPDQVSAAIREIVEAIRRGAGQPSTSASKAQ
jgi:pimeloyl-ACP methyl ester carboxylesterase